MFLQISTTNRCLLGCDFCFGKYPRVVEDMNIDKFTTTLKFYTNSLRRISNVDLTPVVGDFYIKRNPMDYIRLLELTKKVEQYDMVTNILGMSNDAMDYFMKSKKTQLYISVYGHDVESYKKTTGKNFYGRFQERLAFFYSKYIAAKDPPPVTFYMRHAKYKEMPHDSKITMIIRGLKTVRPHLVYIDESSVRNNYTWANQLKVDNPAPIPKKTGICLHSVVQTCVHPTGDISLCGLVDHKKKMLIGHISDPFEEVYGFNSRYREILEKQNIGVYPELCLRCNEYEYYMNDPETIERHVEKNRAVGWL